MDKTIRKKVLLVFGTRPEAIKMCPLVEAFGRDSDFDTLVCVTAQHRQMLDQVLDIFNVKPDYDLDIMQSGQDLTDVTTRVLTGMREVLREARPDVVFVHGDTTTSTAAALAAFYEHIPVAHVEAGLRTNDNPFPEEMNRQLTGRIATYDFAPTPLARQNLLAENISNDKIIVTGNTVIDALQMVIGRLEENADLRNGADDTLAAAGYDLKNKGTRRLVLITGHRRENFGDGFLSICRAIKRLSESFADVDFVYPMHLNPNVRRPIKEVFGDNPPQNTYFIEPLEYLTFVRLMGEADIVLTDSGGIQEEAPGLGKPVLVMRYTTERPEAVDAGTVRLVGTDEETIVSETSLLLNDRKAYEQMSHAVNPYGDGRACERIVERMRI